jgi:hypothetical protein
VFVAAVKRNEVGVSPASYSVASVPGTIPATVRPPRIPELADAPLATGQPIAPAAGASHGVDGAPMRAATPAAEPVRVASANATAPSNSSATSGNFFSNMFSSSSGDDNSMIDRAAKLIGLGGADEKPAAAAPSAKPKPQPRVAARHAPKPAPKPAAAQSSSTGSGSSNGAIRPQPAQAEWPKPAATQQTASPAPAGNGAIAGAAPVVPAGTFDNRWSAFR